MKKLVKKTKQKLIAYNWEHVLGEQDIIGPACAIGMSCGSIWCFLLE